jgi:hypothetical protein
MQMQTPEYVDQYMRDFFNGNTRRVDKECLRSMIDVTLRTMIYTTGWLPNTEERCELLASLLPDMLMDMIANGEIDHTVGDGWVITYLTNIQHTQEYELEDLTEYLDIILEGVPRITINSLQDLVKLVDKFVANSKESYLYPVSYVYDPIAMMSCGFFPTTDNMNNKNSDTYFVDYINLMDYSSIDFWSSNSTQFEEDCNVSDRLKLLTKQMRWKYSTLQQHKTNAIETADSLPLLLQAPDMLYKGSKRPITDMSLFRSSISLRTSSPIPQGNLVTTITLRNAKVNVIPVTRYAAGMSKGLYYNNRPANICGTFYYHEPESTTLLSFNTYRVYKNKHEACQDLDPSYARLFTKYTGIKSGQSVYYDYFNGYLPGDLMMTPNEAFAAYKEDSDIWDKEMVDALPQVKHMAGTYLGLYAFEDKLDQPICLAAKKLGIDVVVLTHMVGRFQVVTEVLDTRSIEDTFASLVYTF